jgi:hypothetical protein
MAAYTLLQGSTIVWCTVIVMNEDLMNIEFQNMDMRSHLYVRNGEQK